MGSGRRQPVLVTGTHRSGTTWTGAMLECSGRLAPIHEPFNPGNLWSWIDPPPERWYHHVDEQHPDPRIVEGVERVVALRQPLRAHLARARSPRNVAALARDVALTARWRRQGRAALMKDPIALLSAPWLVDRFGFRPVVLVRHPAAFVSSLKRLDWQFDFANLTGQASLMSGPLAPQADTLLAMVGSDADVIDQGIAVWNVLNRLIAEDYAPRDGWIVRRYEDLAADPYHAFESLYAELGLAMTGEVRARMDSLVSGSGSDADHMGVKRDSRSALWSWMERLDDDEVDRVRVGTAAVAAHWYSDADWSRPQG